MAVYFLEAHEGKLIRIGYSSEPEKDRIPGHKRALMPLLAVMPGTMDDETALHEFFTGRGFRAPIDGARSYYFARPELENYILSLVRFGYATTDLKTLPSLQYAGYQAFGPQYLPQWVADSKGQLLLGSDDPSFRRRLKRESEYAYLRSNSDDWYTPRSVIELARAAMGSIDTDPATCAAANQVVAANITYTIQSNGLRDHHRWPGNVWLNPPYGRGDNSAKRFIEKLIREINGGITTQAMTCLNVNSMTAIWFGPVWQHAAIHIIWNGRLNFNPPLGKEATSPNKGTVLSYFGDCPDKAANVFSPYGKIIKTWNSTSGVAA